MKDRTFTKWTDGLDRKLIELYPNNSNAEIAVTIGLTESAVGARAFKLSLFKTKEFHAERRAASQFKKGHTPCNKGVLMSPEVYEKAKRTMFKKGNLPHNTRSNGETSIRKDKAGRPYKFIRAEISKWIPYAWHVWQQNNGEIPKGMCVWHKDGNTLNDRLENLELITKKENRLRNSATTNLPDRYVAYTLATKNNPELIDELLKHEPLIELKRNQLKLRRLCKKEA